MVGQAGSGVDETVFRLGLELPEGQRLSRGTGARVDMTSDGLGFIYVGEGLGAESSSHLWFRDLRRQRATPIEGTGGAVSPTFSPDEGSLAFYRDAAIWTLDRGGDTPIMAVDDLGSGVTSLDWAADGFIYYGGRGVFRVPAGGGPTELVVSQDEERRLFFGPQVLPNGRGVIFALGQNETRSENVVAAADLETGTIRVLTNGVSAIYSKMGYLLVVRADGQVDAVPFDEDQLEISGPVQTVGTGIGIGMWGAVDLALSQSGTLLYTTGAQEPQRQVVFVDQAGFEKPVDDDWTGPWESVLLSPDERRLAVGTGFGASPQLWIRDLDRGQMTRLGIEGELNRRPSWSENGNEVTFISNRDGYRAVYRKRADGVGPAELVLAIPDEHVDEAAWSPGGEWLVYRTGMTGGDGRDLYAWHVTGDSLQVPIAANPAYDELSLALSPDGRWLAYASAASGSLEIYVRPFPNADDSRTQISVAGGSTPRWRDDGAQIFFEEQSPTGGRMIDVAVATDPGFRVLGSRALFDTTPYFITNTGFDYHGADGTFLMIREDASVSQGGLTLIRNFETELSLSAAN